MSGEGGREVTGRRGKRVGRVGESEVLGYWEVSGKLNRGGG